MKVRLTTFLLLIWGIAYGQDAPLLNTKLCIETNPFSLFDYDGPSYTLGAELKVFHNISVYIEGGKYFPINTGFFSESGRLTNENGYIGKAELKYYLNEEQYQSGGYLSVEGVYKKKSYDWADTITQPSRYVKTFSINKNVQCINGNIGCLFTFQNRIVLDVWFGVGVRFKEASTSLTPQEYHSIDFADEVDYDFIGLMNTIGNVTYLNFTGGVRIGYCIR